MSNSCEWTTSSCAQIQPYKAANVSLKSLKYHIQQISLGFHQAVLKVSINTVKVAEFVTDICSKKHKPELLKFMFAYFGIPNQCPFTKPSLHCFDGATTTEFNEKTKRLFPIFASHPNGVKMTVEVQHDSGKSCFEVDSKIFLED